MKLILYSYTKVLLLILFKKVFFFLPKYNNYIVIKGIIILSNNKNVAKTYNLKRIGRYIFELLCTRTCLMKEVTVTGK